MVVQGEAGRLPDMDLVVAMTTGTGPPPLFYAPGSPVARAGGALARAAVGATSAAGYAARLGSLVAFLGALALGPSGVQVCVRGREGVLVC